MKQLFILPLLLLALVAIPASAQETDLPDPGTLPGEAFYFLDMLSEGIGNIFTFGEVAKAERAFALAEERLAEAEALTGQGKAEQAVEATARYEEKLAEAQAKAAEARQNGKDVAEVEAQIAAATSKHQAVLAEVLEKVPEEAKAAIERAMEAAGRGGETATDAAAGDRPEAAGGISDRPTEEGDLPSDAERGTEASGRSIPENSIEAQDPDDDGDGVPTSVEQEAGTSASGEARSAGGRP